MAYRWLAVVLVVFLTVVVLVGRIPIRGQIVVDASQSDRLAQILKENRIVFWSGYGSLGMMSVELKNPLALWQVDDVVIEDARQNNYKAIVRYRCLISYFDHDVMINFE